MDERRAARCRGDTGEDEAGLKNVSRHKLLIGARSASKGLFK